MAILKTVLIILIIGIVGGMIGGFFIIRSNNRKPEEADRKWTDPKFRS